MITRRQLIVAAGALPAGVVAVSAGSLIDRTSVAAATVLPTPAGLVWPRRPGVVFEDPAQRAFGPVMFIGDSTSAGHVGRFPPTLAARGVGPYRADLNLARLISRDKSLRPSAITAVRRSRSAGFDPPSYVVALGFSDIIGANQDPRFAKDPVGATVAMIEPLLIEIGTDRVVGFLNLFGTVSSKSSRAKLFNRGLNLLAGQWPNLHVIDWASVAKHHVWWHKPDGFHYGWVGALERQKFVATAMGEMATVASGS